MVIPGISAISSGARVVAIPRVRNVARNDGLSFDASVEDIDAPEEAHVVRRRFRSGRPGREAIKAAGSAASRSSAGVLDQLSRLKLGG